MPGPNDQQLKPATPHPDDVATRWMWLGVFLPIAFGAWSRWPPATAPATGRRFSAAMTLHPRVVEAMRSRAVVLPD